MIAWLEGIVAEKTLDGIVLNVHGVGYGALVSAADHASLVVGSPAKLYVHEHIREDAHDLYGFTSLEGKQLFEQLLSVKNVGPKVALAVLGIGSYDMIRGAIAGGDVKLLQTAKGVGKRAAEQMVVELRDKVGLIASIEAEGVVMRGGVNQSDEAAQALIALGYSEYDAQTALQNIDSSLTTEERITHALKGSR